MLGRRALGWCVLLLLPTVGLEQSDRLQIRFNGEATLSVSGDVPEFGFGPFNLTYGWGICGDSGSCTRDYPWSILGSVARWGAGTGYSFSTSINLILHNNFTFDFSPPTFSIPGYTYFYKHSLGFIYFVQPLSVGSSELITSAWCGPYTNPPPDCCSSSYATLDFSVALRTSVGELAIGENLDASCSAGENCGVNFEFIEWPSSHHERQGYKPHQLDLGTRQGSTVHREKVEAVLQLRAFGTLCGSAGGTVGGSAATGIVLQSAPHPLGVPAIGENEYVWSSDSPAKLTIPARAYAYTWGWEPDLGWLADKTVFRVEPDIPTEDTKPGYKTVAQGRELVAQSLDGQTDSLVDGLVYRSRYLPPKNTDFGKKKVYFEVEGNKVDYADIEVFYPSNATNHPPGGPKGFLIPLIDRCRQSVPELREPTLNWFYYYWNAYGRHENVYFARENSYNPTLFGLTCEEYRREGCEVENIRIYIFDTVSPCSSFTCWVPLFRLEYRTLEPRQCSGVYSNLFITRADEELIVYGIHRYIEILEHELAHKRHFTAGILCRRRPYYQDIDWDGLDDSWEIRHGLHPCFINSVDPDIPDYEVIAYIEGYGKLLSAERFWEEDWADDCGHDPCRSIGNHRFGGINRGCPPSPFPWRYVRGTRVSSEPYHNDLLTEIPDLGR